MRQNYIIAHTAIILPTLKTEMEGWKERKTRDRRRGGEDKKGEHMRVRDKWHEMIWKSLIHDVTTYGMDSMVFFILCVSVCVYNLLDLLQRMKLPPCFTQPQQSGTQNAMYM